MTARELLKILKKDGWYESETKGSHIQLVHPTKKEKLLFLIILEIFQKEL